MAARDGDMTNERTSNEIIWELFRARRQQENAEASVALSHEPDHDCATCQRVRARDAARTEGYERGSDGGADIPLR